MHLLKSKLLYLSHNVIVLVERYDIYIRVYYADGHSEIIVDNIQNYIIKNKGKIGYKKPILINNQLLYPTIDQKNDYCCWIDLEQLDDYNEFYMNLLKQKSIYEKAIAMYLKQKEKMLLKDG